MCIRDSTKEIIRKIAESDIAIVDITGQNPNVFLELGVRFALRRTTTIPLMQDDTEIPFDIKNFRCIKYNAHYTGPEKAIEDIATALRQSGDDRSKMPNDSLVFEALPHLEVNIPSIDRQDSAAAQVMPWSYYWKRLDDITVEVNSLYRDGRYKPVAVIGITNGGALFADLLTRQLFDNSTPTVSLWANRSSNQFFENDMNESIMKGIKKLAKASENPSVLLVDDIVASGTTHYQAIQFLRENLPDSTDIRFLPLFSRNQKYFDKVKDHILWRHPVFDVSDRKIAKLHQTDWVRLPYDKDIRST